MPVEDVQFMLKHNVPDSALIFVNSAQRDYRHYPHPSNYVVDLQEPIRNVFGIEVLDSAIANTMYNVDFNNNMLRYVACSSVLSLDLEAAREGLLDGDLLDSAELAALNASAYALGHGSEIGAWLADPTWASFAIAVVDESSYQAHNVPAANILGGAVSPPTSAQKSLLLVEKRFRAVPMQRVTSANAPAFLPPTGSMWIPFDDVWYSVLGVGATENASVAELLMTGRRRAAIVPISSADAATAVQLNDVYASAAPSSAELFDVVTYQVVEVTAEQFSVFVGASVLGGSINRAQGGGICPCKLVLAIASAVIEVGVYTSFPELQTSLQDALTASGCPVGMGSTSDTGIKKQGLLRFAAPSEYRMMISSTHSLTASVVEPDGRASNIFNMAPRKDRTYGAVAVGGLNDPLF